MTRLRFSTVVLVPLVPSLSVPICLIPLAYSAGRIQRPLPEALLIGLGASVVLALFFILPNVIGCAAARLLDRSSGPFGASAFLAISAFVFMQLLNVADLGVGWMGMRVGGDPWLWGAFAVNLMICLWFGARSAAAHISNKDRPRA